MIFYKVMKKILNILLSVLVLSSYVVGYDILKLKEDLKNPKASVRLSVIREVAVNLDEELVDVLIEHLQEETDNFVKCEILETISLIKSSDVFNVLKIYTKDKNEVVRQVAISKVVEFINFDIVDVLNEVITSDNSTQIKKVAIYALKDFKKEKTVKILDEFIKDEKNEKELRLLALTTLAKIGDEKSLEVLKKYSLHKDKEIRDVANKELADFKKDKNKKR
ncbi:MAG: HEAT repeat domain-containing protein [candidate division WOR-3 bacterium]